jgi:serine/threonine-protein kinase
LAVTDDTMFQPFPGQTVAGKYRVERIIAEGGMGVVLVATHIGLRTRVALKILQPSFVDSPDSVTRLMREGRSVAKLRNEHVVRMLDVGTLEDGRPFLVMEYLEGMDLAALIEREGALPVGDAVDYTLQACSGIAAAHAAGIIHRDLKPANLFRTQREDGSACVKVLDFGVAKVLPSQTMNPSLTQPTEVFGSPAYMSPEQVTSAAQVDARTDVWALGVILHELLTGAPTFDAPTVPETFIKVATAEPPSLRVSRPEVPVELEKVISRCLRKNADERYANIAELAGALAPFAPERERRPIVIVTRGADANEPEAAPSTSILRNRGTRAAAGAAAGVGGRGPRNWASAAMHGAAVRAKHPSEGWNRGTSAMSFALRKGGGARKAAIAAAAFVVMGGTAWALWPKVTRHEKSAPSEISMSNTATSPPPDPPLATQATTSTTTPAPTPTPNPTLTTIATTTAKRPPIAAHPPPHGVLPPPALAQPPPPMPAPSAAEFSEYGSRK